MARLRNTAAGATNTKAPKARTAKAPKAIASMQSLSSFVKSICYRICTVWTSTPLPACPTRQPGASIRGDRAEPRQAAEGKGYNGHK